MAARDADDPRGLGELPAPLAMEKRRIELAIGEVAGPAEHDEIKRINLDDARSHVASWVWLTIPVPVTQRVPEVTMRRTRRFGLRAAHAFPARAGQLACGDDVLEQDLAVAGERFDQRQGGPADRACVGADGARRELDVAQASPVQAFEHLRRARDQAIAHGRRHLSVDDNRLEVNDRDGCDRGVGERGGRLLDPVVEGRAELRPCVAASPRSMRRRPRSRRDGARAGRSRRRRSTAARRGLRSSARPASNRLRRRCRCARFSARRRARRRRR